MSETIADKDKLNDSGQASIALLERQLQSVNSLLAQEQSEHQITINKLEGAQNQILQSEKMAAIGQLVAGVAHEINNPTAYVDCNLGKLKEHLASAQKLVGCASNEQVRNIFEEMFDVINESQQGMFRIKEIVKDVKNFARVDDAEWDWQLIDIHQCIESTLNVVWNELKYKAKVVKEYGELPLVQCMPAQIGQVVMNILVNAVHAIAEQGVITITTSAQTDAWVCIVIEDTGQGIASEHLNRIFDPFFTTKSLGIGTGLGLPLSYRIMQRHGGRIEIESEPGVGSKFQIWLPVSRPSTEV